MRKSSIMVVGNTIFTAIVACIAFRNSSKSISARNVSALLESSKSFAMSSPPHKGSFPGEEGPTMASMIPINQSPVCRSILTLFRNSSTTSSLLSYPPSAKQVWETLQRDLVEDSISFASKLWKQHNNPGIRDTFQVMMNLLTPDRMRKSLVHPMPLKDSDKLVEIIRKRLEDPATNPPLRIIALGGSVVWGAESTSNTIPGLEKLHRDFGESFGAAWPKNLPRVLNDVLFQGRDVVEVRNLGVGGITSDIGAILVEYGFLQETGAAPPDIIIAAYGPNDVMLQADQQMEVAQTLVKAVRSMRCDGLPVFISHLDTLMKAPRTIQFAAQGQTQAILAQWYDFMAISFEKTFHDITMRDIPKIRGADQSFNETYNSYWGNPWWNCHPDLTYHSAVSWLLAYSLANSLILSCEYEGSKAEADAEERPPLSLKNLPALTNGADYLELYEQWNQTQIERDAKCKVQRDAGISISKTCEYKWITTKNLGLDSKAQAEEIVNKVLVNNVGWEAAGGLNQFQGTPGWITNAANASFEICVPAQVGPIKMVTIIYLKSYGRKWLNSAVTVETRVVRDNRTSDEVLQPPITLDGIHDSRTSVNYWEKIQLAGGGALPGDRVHVSIRMVGGSTFRINGLIFCSS